MDDNKGPIVVRPRVQVVPVEIREPRDRTESPLFLYLASLNSQRSRYTMEQAMLTVVKVMSKGTITDPYAYPYWDLTRSKVLALRAYLKEKYEPRTVNTYMSAFKGTMRECWRQGYMDRDTLERLIDFKTLPESQVPSGHVPTHDQYLELIGECLKEETDRGIEDAAIITTMYYTGLRKAEVINLKLTAIEELEVDGKELYAFTIKGKGDKVRKVYLPKSHGGSFTLWLNIRREALVMGTFDYVFTSPYAQNHQAPLNNQYIYDMLWARQRNLWGWGYTSPEWFRPHDWRRAFVTRLLRQGIDVLQVSKLAGHSQVDTTRRYDLREEEELSRVILQSVQGF